MTKTCPAARFLLSTFLMVAAAGTAFAQTGEGDIIIVTGSRLNQANLISPSPVFQVDGSEIDTRGTTRIEDLVNILPQTFPGQTSGISNGATGTSTLDLRGIGATRTLVLLDGKRLPFGSASVAAVNLDLVPAQLVEQIDIVTGGASAVYGSDAVAGVANFILRRDFEGLELDGQIGAFQDGNNDEFANELLRVSGITAPGAKLDGRNVSVSGIFGKNIADGRGNITAFFSYQNQNEIRHDDRDFSTCAFNSTQNNGPTVIGGITCGGSFFFRRIFTPGGDFFLDDDNVLVPFTNEPSQTFNFSPDNFLIRNNERFNVSAFAHYDVTDDIEAYLDFGFTDNNTDAQIAFSGIFFGPFDTNCDNPLLDTPTFDGSTLVSALGCDAAAIDAGADVPLFAAYRNVNGNPRSNFTGLATYRLVGGLRGELGDHWSWDVFGQFSRTNQTSIANGDLSFADVQDGLFVVDDGSGNAVCRSGNAGCLPFNIFDVEGPTAEAVAFAEGQAVVTGNVEQIVFGGTIGGDLGAVGGVRLPWAKNGVQTIIGFEYREDSLERTPDDLAQIPFGQGLTGVSGATLPIAGSVRVTEFFGEVQIPLIEDQPFFEQFAINGAYRFSDYAIDGNDVQNSFSTDTFAAGVTWQVTPDLRLRGQFQRAVRAPNVFELFLDQNTGLFTAQQTPNGAFDPCAGDFDPTTVAPEPSATLDQCANTGVSAAQFGSIPVSASGLLNLVTGGNPLLNPERADTYTFGLVYTPTYLDGFDFAVDYYDITLNDALGVVPPQVSLDQCLETGAAAFCNLIVRDQFGSLFVDNSNFEGVQAVTTNISQLATRGIDFAVNYNIDLDRLGLGQWGSLNLQYISSVLLEGSFVAIPGISLELECRGLYRGVCGGPNPEYRHRLLSTWQTPWDLTVTATWRHIGGVQLDTGQSATGGVFEPTGNILDDFLDSANYLDLALQYRLSDDIHLRAGVNNLNGREPELSTVADLAPGNGDTFPGTYDANGRFIFFGVTLGF